MRHSEHAAPVVGSMATVLLLAMTSVPHSEEGPAEEPSPIFQPVTFDMPNSHREFTHWQAEGVQPFCGTSQYWLAWACALTTDDYPTLQAATLRVMGFAGHYPWGKLYRAQRGEASHDLAVTALEQNSSFLNLLPVLPKEKVITQLYEERGITYVDSAGRTLKADVHFQQPLAATEVRSTYGHLFTTVDSVASLTRTFSLVASVAQLLRIAASDEVECIGLHVPRLPLNYESRTMSKVNQLQQGFLTEVQPPTVSWLSGVQYTGDSIWIGIGEELDSTHLDLSEHDPATGDTLLRRFGAASWYPWWGHPEHGTHVAGTAAGNGWMSLARGGDTLRWRGVAPKALLSPASDAGDVNNHSFTEDTCGYYSVFVQWNDDELSDHTGAGTSNNVWTWATANNGSTWTQYGSQIGYYSMLCNNKNAIKVGAIQKLLPLKAAFSSMGPTRDGRIGPDVMAPGAGFSSNWYVEVDSVALVNGSTKKVWHFSDGDPQWSADWLIENPQQSGGQLTFAVRSGGYLWSNSIYPATTVVSSTSDTLVIRYRLNLRDTTYGGYTVSGDSMVHRLMWKRPSDTYAKDDDPWHFVQFMGDRNGWVNRRIWLGDPSLPIGAGGWVNGDTIERIRIEFIGWREKNDAVVSCVANANDYAPGDGTSMACPHVTGIAALMLQKYRNSILQQKTPGGNIHEHPPWNSSVRGILVHTATDMVDTLGVSGSYSPDFLAFGQNKAAPYGRGPDWATGYGLVNAVKALQYVDTLRFRQDTISQRDMKSYSFTVPQGTDTIRVTLCWDDPAYAGNNDRAAAYVRKLVNNLDLYLVPPSSDTAWRPWTLNYAGLHASTVPSDGIDSCWSGGQWRRGIDPQLILAGPAYRGVDTFNNIEMVTIPAPASGQWTAVVEARQIVLDQSQKAGVNQEYSLVFDISVGAPSTDALGPRFCFSGVSRAHLTASGTMQLQGHDKSGSLSGFCFGGAASIETDGDLIRTAFYSDQGAWLNTPGNLTGGLVFVNASGTVEAHISTGGTVHVRGKSQEGMGPF